MRNNTRRILAQGQYMSNDTWRTGLNNNDLIIGPSGAGKTRGYVKPNLLQCEESVIVADTKGSLIGEVGPAMAARGYKVVNIDFTEMQGSYGYNPLDHIRYDRKRHKYVEQDIMTVAAALCPVEGSKEPFWELSARMYLACMLGYVLECLPKREHDLVFVMKLFAEMDTQSKGGSRFDRLLQALGKENPDSFAYQKYRMFKENAVADRTDACIKAVVAQVLDPLTFDGPVAMFRKSKRIRFEDLGREKTAVFLTVSDTDRSADTLVNLFYTQALQSLCRSADKDYPDHRLPVPVRFILDDFATNTVIPDFDNIISVIRSREIYVSVIIQSLTQLEGLYGSSKAMTIANNCDNWLYLGGQDVATARFISVKANRTADTVLNLPLGSAYLFTRGRKPQVVNQFDLKTHEGYRTLPEAAREGEASAEDAEEIGPWSALAG